MRLDMTRFMIDAAVSKAIGDIARDPDRSVRNLVDLGMNFSRGRFQRRFIGSIRTMLDQPDSPYYQVAKRAVSDISRDTLKTFGVNMGYNSFTRGAKAIRELEAAQGVNIPWSITFQYRLAGGGLTAADIDRTIAEAKKLGIYTFAIHCAHDSVCAIAPLLSRHADCAFLLFITPGATNPAQADSLCRVPNLLVAISTDDPAFDAMMNALKADRALCAPYVRYDDSNVDAILTGEWIERTLPYACVFGIAIAAANCPQVTRERVARYALDVRDAQRYPILMIDYFADMLAIDEIISDETCFMAVDADGQVYTGATDARTGENIARGSLLDIIRRVMPRVAGR